MAAALSYLGNIRAGVEIAKEMTEVVERCHKISKSDLSRAEKAMDEIKMTSVRETTRAEIREFQLEGFYEAINRWNVDDEIRDTFRDMGDMMLRSNRRVAFKEFEYKNSHVRIEYAVCVGYRDEDGVFHFAYAKYKCAAALEKSATGYWFTRMIGCWGKESAPITLEQRKLLMGTFVPHQVLTEMENQGIINAVPYKA